MTKDNNNSLSKENQQKALNWLNNKWPQHKRECDICGSKDWQLTEHLVSPLVFHNGGFQLGGMSYPCVSVICKNCANTKYLNAVMMGLIEKKESEKKDGGKDGQ